jgi:Zn-dependent protease with chaperone function
MASEKSRIRLRHLSYEAFVSPTDRIALQNLQRLPVLPNLIQKFNEYAWDKMYYALNTADSVRCTYDQFRSVYKMLREACRILDMPEPELYLRYSPAYNAFTAGVQQPFIVLHSSLANDFTDEELLFILGHELGHIKCGHVLYRMIGSMLIPLLQTIGQATLGLGNLAGRGILSGFLEWMRQSEFSCDRAGLLACQNPQAAFSATMKLGCGNSRFGDEMNVEAFLDQARNYTSMGGLEGVPKALLFFLYNWTLDHPQVIHRAKGLDDWLRSGAYDQILSGDYLRESRKAG